MKHVLKRIIRTLHQLRSFSYSRWRYLFYSLSSKERRTIASFLILTSLAFFSLAFYEYFIVRQPSPAHGGSYVEGIVGEPRYLNPVLGSNSEIDRDLITLLFAGLTKHDPDGNIVGDLAETIEIKERGRVYEFTLKRNLAWPDGEPITIEDVLFTINLIQDPEYQSPLRANWQGVRAEKIDEDKLRLTLNLPYKPFLENATVGILPKHLWQNVRPQNFALAELNVKPVGAGPYVVKKITKDTRGSIRALALSRNKNYHDNVFVEKVSVRFYQGEDELISAYRRGEVDGLGLFSVRNKADLAGRDIKFYAIKMPRYFAVFFNGAKNDNLKDVRVRQALAHATPKERIISEILSGEAVRQEGLFPSWLISSSSDFKTYEFNLESAREILKEAGWSDDNEDGILEQQDKKSKEPRVLGFTLTTTDWPELTQVASILKEQWESIGFVVNLDIIPVNSIQQQVIRPREYEALLFGEVLGVDPDPFSFWHSSQIKDPGLNLSLYENKTADELLEQARQTIDSEQQQAKFEQLEQIIAKDLAAIFLYSPHYIYALPNNIKGVSTTVIGTPSQRFENINQWYIKTRRTRENENTGT